MYVLSHLCSNNTCNIFPDAFVKFNKVRGSENSEKLEVSLEISENLKQFVRKFQKI